MGEALDREVGVQLAVEHMQHVAVELGRHAGGVVVGGDEALGVLDQIGADHKRVASGHDAVEVEEEACSLGRVEVPQRAPRNATARRRPPGMRSRWR